MLGHRGSRLGITAPEIYNMQVRAILEAANQYFADSGNKVNLEIMIPLIFDKKELIILRNEIEKIINEYKFQDCNNFNYKIGTMIELPRAALMASEIAAHADFFSFGTNDLTQATYGISRDDAGSFFPIYKEKNILANDPFVHIDKHAVGYLIKLAINEGKIANNNLKVGVCGEHGGDPESIEFFDSLDVNYISCSPFRVPAARIAAAQAAIRAGKRGLKENKEIGNETTETIMVPAF